MFSRYNQIIERSTGIYLKKMLTVIYLELFVNDKPFKKITKLRQIVSKC